jgi:hypothetical protein
MPSPGPYYDIQFLLAHLEDQELSKGNVILD